MTGPSRLRLHLNALVLSFALASARAAVVEAPPALPPSAVSAAFGPTVGAQIQQVAASISLRSPALTLSSFEAIRAGAPALKDPTARAAAVAVLGALSAPSAELPARLAETDVPPAAAARLVSVAQKLDAAASSDAKTAAKVDAARRAGAATASAIAARPGKKLSAGLVATLRQFLDWGKTEAKGVSAEASPAVRPRPRPSPAREY